MPNAFTIQSDGTMIEIITTSLVSETNPDIMGVSIAVINLPIHPLLPDLAIDIGTVARIAIEARLRELRIIGGDNLDDMASPSAAIN